MAIEDADVGLFDAHRYVHAGRVFNSENIDPSDSSHPFIVILRDVLSRCQVLWLRDIMPPAGTYIIMAPGIKSPYLLLPASTRFLVQKYLPVILQDEELVLPWNVCVPKAGIRATQAGS